MDAGFEPPDWMYEAWEAYQKHDGSEEQQEAVALLVLFANDNIFKHPDQACMEGYRRKIAEKDLVTKFDQRAKLKKRGKEPPKRR